MIAKLSSEQREALKKQPDGPLTVEDDENQRFYVLIPQDQFRNLENLLSAGGELTRDEMLAIAAQGLDDPDGWGAPGMDEYDEYGSQAK